MTDDNKPLTIGKLAERMGLSPDTLRYYEKMKLIKADSRSRAGYRLYTEQTISVLRFIKGAKALDFSLVEIQKLLALTSSDKATCAQIIDKTEAKIAEAETQILELKEIRKALKALVKQCPGGNAPVDMCPILEHIQGKRRRK
jgi:DNA-binding transcriptional MerR regulator